MRATASPTAVALTSYGSYASSLRVAQNASPRYDPGRFAFPPAPGTTATLVVPDGARPGQTFTASASLAVPEDGVPVTGVRIGQLGAVPPRTRCAAAEAGREACGAGRA